MKMTAFWDIAPCSLAEVYRCFRDAYCLHHQGYRPHNGGLRISETSVYCNETTRRYALMMEALRTYDSLLQSDYMALYFRRLLSSYSLQLVPENSRFSSLHKVHKVNI
jgi:hypothetical protein